jgi:hypothetical protein
MNKIQSKICKDTNKIKTKLSTFFTNNPDASLKKEESSYNIINVWNDDTIYFPVNEGSDKLIDVLNKLIFPPHFSAIYHIESNEMEYIFTFLNSEESYFNRKFEFTLDGKIYSCAYKRSSDELLLLVETYKPIEKYIHDDHRNMNMLKIYIRLEKEGGLPKNIRIEPISFYVKGFYKYNEDVLIETSKHLNFFMSYYDRKTPLILMHSPKTQSETEGIKQTRLDNYDFPKKISSRRQDPFLLDLALEANRENTRLAFIYYYQILEYAAFYYIDSDIKRRLQQIITRPDIHTNLDKHIPKILDTVIDFRHSDEAKISKVVEIGCSPETVWKEIAKSLSYFTQKHIFEGGFVLDPFISANINSEGFCSMWCPKMPDTIRKIRNAIVHGRENRLGLVISPTKDNELKLKPWIPVIRRIAEEVIIFGS